MPRVIWRLHWAEGLSCRCQPMSSEYITSRQPCWWPLCSTRQVWTLQQGQKAALRSSQLISCCSHIGRCGPLWFCPQVS